MKELSLAPFLFLRMSNLNFKIFNMVENPPEEKLRGKAQ